MLPKKRGDYTISADNIQQDIGVQLLALNPDGEIIGIRIFPNTATEFNNMAELREWSCPYIASANQLKKEIEMGDANMSDSRIVRNLKISQSEQWVEKLQLCRDAKGLVKHLEKEKQLRSFTIRLLNASQRPGHNTDCIIGILNEIKGKANLFTALMLKKHPQFIDAVLQIYDWLYFSSSMITFEKQTAVGEPLLQVLKHFKERIFLLPSSLNFAAEFKRIVSCHNAKTQHLTKSQEINFTLDN